nr:tripartite motif-containing protein 16-like [Misgurnus anguillicaudatus]
MCSVIQSALHVDRICRICLKKYWDNSQIYSCPNCKETFSKRPELNINTLREVALIFKEKFSLRRSEVLCDVCDERKLKALKSCLMCQMSYCETHLNTHEKFTLKKHKLLDPVENIKDYICVKHERPLELFCSDDLTRVCVFCTDGDHKNHNTVPLEEESKERKTQLMKTQTDIQQMIQKRIKKIQDIKHSAELRKRSREQEKAASVEVFSDLIRSIERCQTELLEMMKKEQKAAEKQDEDLIKDLEQEITDLKLRDSELEKITHSEDHLHLVQIDSSSLYRAPDMKNWSEISMKTHVSVETLRRALTQLQETLNEKLTQTEDLALRGRAVQSSTGYGWEASNAIDNSPLTCTHTDTSDNPWWRLDLLDSYYISTVVITNRGDCCAERLNGAEIRIGNSLENNGNNNTRCAVLNGVAAGQSVSVKCHNINGQYVNVIIPGSSKILSLAKVEVYQAGTGVLRG